MDEYIELRHTLHAHPNRSEHEEETRQLLMNFLKERLTHTKIVDCGRYFYAVKREPAAERTLAFRADHDAILDEKGQPFHGCGHDGHSTMLAAAAVELDQVTTGNNLVYIFQHAEENGVGAKVCQEVLDKEQVDAVYGLHNWPGFPLGEIVSRSDTFYCASKGLKITLKGKQAHASMPEQGVNPVYAFAELACELQPLAEFHGFHPTTFWDYDFQGLVLCTIVHLNVGEADAFGVSPGVGETSLTLRAEKLEDIEQLQAMILHKIEQLAPNMILEYTTTDEFPDTSNAPDTVEAIRAKLKAIDIELHELEDPIRSSEDFGWYLKKRPGCFFILGSGEDHVPVHHPDYEFPDQLIPYGIKFWKWLAHEG